MTADRASDLKHDYLKALKRLREAVEEDLSKGSIVIDGTIQRFEFVYELGWKLLKAVLDFQGVNAPTPRQAIKEAFQAGLIPNGEDWIDMLEDRNRTSHIYDEKSAKKIYQKIKRVHLKTLEGLPLHLPKNI
ncbi:MAG: DUF86 domain-containing protein [Candidatus Omnitrophica bacterium]|nr:DUF86 domain-containing protein [Candidatus Omnitrophota bacterium]